MRSGPLALIAATMIFAGSAGPLHAQGSLADQLSVCARIDQTEARLACYDSVAGAAGDGSGAAAPASPGPAPQATRGAPAPAASASDFGSETIRPAGGRAQDDGESGEISATVASARDNGLGMWQINLADGAVWRMTERAANFRPPAPNASVTIRKAALGSYLMQVGRQPSVRVTRVR